jgi:hypothetical protein
LSEVFCWLLTDLSWDGRELIHPPRSVLAQDVRIPLLLKILLLFLPPLYVQALFVFPLLNLQRRSLALFCHRSCRALDSGAWMMNAYFSFSYQSGQTIALSSRSNLYWLTLDIRDLGIYLLIKSSWWCTILIARGLGIAYSAPFLATFVVLSLWGKKHTTTCRPTCLRGNSPEHTWLLQRFFLLGIVSITREFVLQIVWLANEAPIVVKSLPCAFKCFIEGSRSYLFGSLGFQWVPSDHSLR